MKLLITGGIGFVGLNLARFLAQALQCEVTVADIISPDDSVNQFLQPVQDLVRYESLDVRDRAAFGKLVADRAITIIVHAAAITPSLRQERDQAPLITEVNLGGALNAIAVGYESPRVERVLLCSSSGVYGTASPASTELQQETGSLQLDNLYAITKYSAELLAERYAQLGTTMMASVRLASVYGPMEMPGKSRGSTSHVHRLMTAMREGRRLRLFGSQIRRDWVYTRDVAEAVRSLICVSCWNYPVYNIGSGTATCFEDVVAPFVRHGLDVDWVNDPQQADISMTMESARAALDISRLQIDANFTPCYDFESGISDYFQFA